jgi:glycyl-tRNA synthetase
VRLRQHEPSELAHYAKIAFDIEYETPFGWKEWEGIHWRSDWDLARHGQYSGRDFTYTDSETGERFTPWIVETSGGVDRTFLFLLLDAYSEEKSEDQARVVLKLEPQLAPYKVAVFPLLANKPDLVNWARKIYENLKPNFMAAWDDRGNIGKRYFSQDEIGTPWCVTIDFQTLKDKAVTVRDRDTTRQERVGVDKLGEYFQNRLK